LSAVLEYVFIKVVDVAKAAVAVVVVEVAAKVLVELIRRPLWLKGC
jgi:hypothetical protein